MSEQETIDTLQGQIAALKGAKEVAEDNLARIVNTFRELTDLFRVDPAVDDIESRVTMLEEQYDDVTDVVTESMTFQTAVEEIVRAELEDTKFVTEIR